MPRYRFGDHLHLACGLGLLMCAGQAPAGGTDVMEAYLARDGRLRSELLLRDAQSGFAGVTTDVWQVAPDGSYRVARELDGRDIALERTGSLTPEQLAGLARALSDHDLRALPAASGEVPEVNARQLTLRFGETTSILNLMPGEDLDEAACKAAPSSDLRRFAAITEAIMYRLQAADQPEEGGGTVRCTD